LPDEAGQEFERTSKSKKFIRCCGPVNARNSIVIAKMHDAGNGVIQVGGGAEYFHSLDGPGRPTCSRGDAFPVIAPPRPSAHCRTTQRFELFVSRRAGVQESTIKRSVAQSQFDRLAPSPHRNTPRFDQPNEESANIRTIATSKLLTQSVIQCAMSRRFHLMR
jgi:hypothetical protein